MNRRSLLRLIGLAPVAAAAGAAPATVHGRANVGGVCGLRPLSFYGEASSEMVIPLSAYDRLKANPLVQAAIEGGYVVDTGCCSLAQAAPDPVFCSDQPVSRIPLDFEFPDGVYTARPPHAGEEADGSGI